MRVTKQQTERMICYEDAEVIVVHKPPFLAVETRDPRQQDLLTLLINRRTARGEVAYIGVVHRLDQPVEGLLVLAKTREAAAFLSSRLRAGDFSKEYLAVVQGVTEESGTLVHTLKKDGKTNTSAVVPEGTVGGKEARLSYKRLAAADEKSLLRIRHRNPSCLFYIKINRCRLSKCLDCKLSRPRLSYCLYISSRCSSDKCYNLRSDKLNLALSLELNRCIAVV